MLWLIKNILIEAWICWNHETFYIAVEDSKTVCFENMIDFDLSGMYLHL